VSFTHAGVAPRTCATCHNGSMAKGRSAAHFTTTQPCDVCHRTTAWTPVIGYRHISPFYRQHNAGVACRTCHTTNGEVIAWKAAAYKPNCAACHAPQFRANAHLKVESPRIFYTVAELADCSGSCHEYTNSTFTVIKRAKSGHHRATSGGF